MNDALRPALDAPVPLAAPPVLPAPDPDAAEALSAFPSDHPRWRCDVVAISARTRAVLAAIPAVAIRVFTFWDHRAREITVGARRVAIDASGSYRLR